jgi:tetratricopeptide (TPR) repeat protein
VRGRFALIIGNKEYDDPLLQGLHAPEYDVQDLASLLEDPNIGAFQVTRLLDRPFAEVRSAVSDFLGDRQVDDTVLLYFSGHGIKSRWGTVYLAVRDTRHKNPAALGIDAHFLRTQMQQCYSQRQVLILDCCYSGAFAKAGAMGPEDTIDTKAEFMGGGFGQTILTATNAVQIGIEADQVIGDSRYSLFTHYLIEGLRTGQADGAGASLGVADGSITDVELYDYAYQRVDRTKEQIPQRLVQGQGSPIVIARNPFFGADGGTHPLVLGEEPPPAKIDALLAFVRARSWLSLAIAAAVLGSLAAVCYHLYRIEKEHRAQAAEWYSEGLKKLHGFNTEEAEKLFGWAAASDPGNSLAHAYFALALRERGNQTAAQPEARSAFNLRRSLGARDRTWVEGIFNEVNWRWDDAINSYRQLWKNYRDIDAGLRLANAQSISGHGTDALHTVEDLRRLPAAGSDPRVDFQEAQAADAVGDFSAELKAAGNMAEHSPEGSALLGTALNQQCWALYKQDNSDGAKAACKQALTILNNNGDQLGRARTLTRESLILSHQNPPQNDQAMTLQERALTIARQLHSEIDEAGALHNRANLFASLRNYAKASEDFRAALKIVRTLNDPRELAGLENDRAASLIDQCQCEEAQAASEEVRQAYSAIGSQDGVAIATSNIGAMLYLLGDLKGAEEKLKEALGLAAQWGLRLDTADWKVLLGDVFLQEDNLQRAEWCFRGENCYDDSTKFERKSTSKIMPEAASDFALLQIEQGQAHQAEQTARRELANSRGKDPDNEAAARDALARALVAQGAVRSAEAHDTIATAYTLTFSDCRRGVSLAITDARAQGSLHQLQRAQDELGNALRNATNSKLVQYQFEARLARAEIESSQRRTPSAKELAQRLHDDAQRKGFLLIARKADQFAHHVQSASAH